MIYDTKKQGGVASSASQDGASQGSAAGRLWAQDYKGKGLEWTQEQERAGRAWLEAERAETLQEYIGLLEGQELCNGGDEIKTLRERARLYREAFARLWPEGQMPSILVVAAKWPMQTRLVNLHLLGQRDDLPTLPRGLREATAQIRAQEQIARRLWKKEAQRKEEAQGGGNEARDRGERVRREGGKVRAFVSPWHPATLKGAVQRSAELDGLLGADGWADEVDE